MDRQALERAISTVLNDCLGVVAGESVVVVTDPKRRGIAEGLVEGARAIGADAVLIDMMERATHGTEPPDPIAAAMRAADVVIAPTTKSLSHTEARHAASKTGARIATMPQITEDMLARTMSADYASIRARSRAVADALTAGREVWITSPEGTDVTLSIAGRQGLPDDADLKARGAFGNLPAGEGFIAPVEGETQGRIVFDGSLWPIGLLDEPLVAAIQEGYATGFSGPSAERFRQTLEPHGRAAFAVAELGIGTNEAAQLTGVVLEDEKILGTIHIAFGDNHSFGGTLRVASHQDGVVLHPTVSIDGNILVSEGRLLV